ncbi:transcription initiation factor IIF beta subunit [Laetiporus sulphureus 93-53]|uniref:Transcription initiation factor IIF subunit beta n=1 Tax=Laetiporus sulphureus 93-53 TaxID=1314785 RepID=A0A165BFH1_9APHY|nr:transcription initiation factor IIF beta subunit [Laetiporus sulphureus 93-53]KZT00944.1 transcription initiation factor IIF beta subunit [Laetiporus sulphureus 93-53]
MDGPSVEEDTKHFDSVQGAHDGDSQPDPNEPLMLDAGNGRVWLVKIPKTLMEKWSKIDAEGVHLANIRVYHNAKAPSGKKPRIVLILPSDPETPDVLGERYEMEMVNESVENQVVIAEREKEPGTGSRARTTILTGRVKHECHLKQASLTAQYRQRVKQRTIAANTPKRKTKPIEEAMLGRGNVKMLTSGAAPNAPMSLYKPKPKLQKGQYERMARMPRDQLLDELFRAFQEHEFWAIKALRERTQQPEAYLKEVLSEIAINRRSGEHAQSWELLPNFKGEGMKAENVPGPSLSQGMSASQSSADVKMEEAEEDEDEDEDEDDMEEVS